VTEKHGPSDPAIGQGLQALSDGTGLAGGAALAFARSPHFGGFSATNEIVAPRLW
jgi:hypothetical protein